ncbi:DUF4302 domain-containing protein [Reichenbachiella ulvae]|uniref:DUF4302 domain-containing protein n=1 Tax=Reichenbachiella ulvae TaxID=2980104 RepID=A0ABT3CRL3_9BACT|nr:DUF4302 domain-containing protein [Reichenbachiella ulvae]MCV9386328.1 DUF4302 domain-containing protein [Reichenbachiella ulvae]
MRIGLYIALLAGLAFGCTQEYEPKLAPADERREAAINDLKDKLMAPEHGWMLDYRPVPEAGTYYILMDFDENEVRIQSDVANEEGSLFDQTIPYRVDVQLDIQLTLETYAVFHYLFEQDQSTFGAEFEFFYLDEVDGNLRLYSKTDPADETTIITLVPAPANAADAFSREEADAFDSYRFYSQPFGDQIIQQLYLANDDVSIYWEVDLVKRFITLDGAAQGSDLTAITAANWVDINLTTGFSFLDGDMVLESPIAFEYGGKNFSISRVSLDSYSETGEVYCDAETRLSPVYSTSIAGLGAGELRHSLFQSGGLLFTAQPDIPYSVNVFFVGDSTGLSLTSEDLIIGSTYPEATGFIFNYGRDSAEIDYSVGISFSDDNDVNQTHLRGFETVAVQGNYIQVLLNEEFNYTNAADVDASDEQNLRTVTDEIFEGGQFYISEWPVQEGLVIFRVFNPCNGYEFALVQ